MGPFAYAAFFMALYKFNDFAYDMRTSGHKAMGPVCYLFIIMNRYAGDSYVALDVALFAFATFYFYRAMSNNFEHTANGAVATIVVSAVLIGATYWGTRTLPKKPAKPGKPSAEEAAAQAMLKTMLEHAQQASGGMREIDGAEAHPSPRPVPSSQE